MHISAKLREGDGFGDGHGLWEGDGLHEGDGWCVVGGTHTVEDWTARAQTHGQTDRQKWKQYIRQFHSVHLADIITSRLCCMQKKCCCWCAGWMYGLLHCASAHACTSATPRRTVSGHVRRTGRSWHWGCQRSRGWRTAQGARHAAHSHGHHSCAGRFICCVENGLVSYS